MPRTAPSIRTDTPTRLAELGRQHPEWRTWIAILGVAERALDDERWSTLLSESELVKAGSESSGDTPLLHGQVLPVEGTGVQDLMGKLLATVLEDDPAAGRSLRRYRPSKADALQLLLAAVRQDTSTIERLASESEVDAGALGSVAHLAALPLLRSCGQLLEGRVPSAWSHGYCPVCAAWPILVERRGLDRSRRLRCGRCAAQWEVQWLYCIYCGERDHERLGTLEEGEQGEIIKVETCATCRGYLKSIASLQGLPPFELLLRDLETVEFDLVALERGYYRTLEPGFALDLQIVDHASR